MPAGLVHGGPYQRLATCHQSTFLSEFLSPPEAFVQVTLQPQSTISATLPFSSRSRFPSDDVDPLVGLGWLELLEMGQVPVSFCALASCG